MSAPTSSPGPGSGGEHAAPPVVRDIPTGSTGDLLTPAAPGEAPSTRVMPNWADSLQTLPQELRDAPAMQNHKGFEDFARDYVTQNRLVGFEKIARPKADSPAEDWEVFYDSMGRPEDPSQYELGDFAPPEGVPWDAEMQTGMMNDFHAAGLSSKQAQQVLKAYAGRQVERERSTSETMQQQRGEAQAKLRESWGASFDGRSSVALDTFEFIFGENAGLIANVTLPDGQKFGNHPAVIESMWHVGSKMQEAKMIGEKNVGEPSLSPVEANRLAKEMEANPEIAKDLAAGDSNNAHVKRWNMLMEFANPPE